MADQYEIGETYYTANGDKVYLDAITTDGKFVVSQILRFSDYGDSFYEDTGQAQIVGKIYAEAPVAVIDERFAAAQEKLAEIERHYQTRYAEVINAEREIQSRLAKLQKFNGLDRLEDFIDGKITHVVLVDEDYAIKGLDALEEIDYGRKQGLKLVSLFGKSDGDLLWCVNQYRDGSGGMWREIIPCANEDDAVAKRRERLLADIQEQFAHIEPDRPYWFLRRVQKAIELNIDVPADVTAKYQELQKVHLAAEEAKARKAVEDAQAKLEEFLAKAGAA